MSRHGLGEKRPFLGISHDGRGLTIIATTLMQLSEAGKGKNDVWVVLPEERLLNFDSFYPCLKCNIGGRYLR